ncbi:LCP family protein [Fervidobacterium thailandense]|uniref:Transcriptional regulator n=1 Tax=Fervidobacterium thailandense TaxID=1008305 RepID=A0A1E3G1K2_9BACT|nr:LCP family protein [Fervidobacterium thailandense]ODN29743.1 transcriptional regulator [Fervidobacterium thailandense]
MKNLVYLFAIIVGIAMSLSVTLLWIDFFVRILIVPTEDPMNILVLGLDKDIGGTRRTDVILVASVDLTNRKLVISSIPRDLMIDGRKINGYFQIEGLEAFKKRIENLTGLEIHRHVIVDYDIFKYLGDELGPVEVFVDRPMHYKDVAQGLEIDFSPGFYKMKGKELLAYLRFRKTAEGDIGRLDKQRVIIEKLAQNAVKKNFITLTSIYKEIKKMSDFNIEIGELVYMYSKLRKGFSIQSVPFPFYIGTDGNLYIDEAKMPDYKASLKGEKRIQEKYRYYVINNAPNKSQDYYEKFTKFFNSLENKPLRVFFEGVDVDFKKNTVLILRKNENLKEFVEDLVKKLQLGYCEIVYTDERFDYIPKYLAIIGELAKNQIQLSFPIDFIMVLTEEIK